jgi:hypothetical protein
MFKEGFPACVKTDGETYTLIEKGIRFNQLDVKARTKVIIDKMQSVHNESNKKQTKKREKEEKHKTQLRY